MAASTPTAADDDKESSDITIEVLQQHFHQPLIAVAEELGVSLTMIKRLCRKLGMPRWPFRQIDSINKAMEDLHDQLEGARTEADRTRYYKALEDAEKKKQLITRGAAAGVDPNVRNALYLADTANVSEEDIFGNPELMPKLSAALKTITKRKRVKGKPLVDLIATVQRDGSLPECVQSSNGSAATTTPSSASSKSAAAKKAGPTANPATARSGGAAPGGGPSRRQMRPPAIADAIATSNEEYAANIEHAYGGVNKPESSTSDTTSVSSALSSLGNSGHSSMEEFGHHGWGHNGSAHQLQDQQQQQQQQPYGRHSTGNTPAVANARNVLGMNGTGFLQESFADSPTSSCATLVAGNSPSGGGRRLSPGGSLSGAFSPAVGGGASNPSAPTGVLLQQPPSFVPRSTESTGAGGNAGRAWVGQQQPSASSAASRPQQQQQQQQQQQSRAHKHPSISTSMASTDLENLDTSQLLEFDDDDDDEVGPYSGPGYTVPAGDMNYANPAIGGGNGASTENGISPEDLQELEDALLMDSFTVATDDGVDEDQDMPCDFPKLKNNTEKVNFPGLYGATKPLPRKGGGSPAVAAGVPRMTPRSAGAAGSGSSHVQMFGGRGASPSRAGSASPVGAAANPSASVGPPRPGPRGMGRPRSSQVPPRPYTPGKSSRGGLWLAHGLRGENSPRVGSSPRPPTPGTPGTHSLTPAGGGNSSSGGGTGGPRVAPSPNGRRRGGEAFPSEHFPSQSSNDTLSANTALMGGPSPKSRRVGGRFPAERFPSSPKANLSPRVGLPPQSPLSGGGGSFNVACSPLGGSDRTYFPAPAASAAAAVAALAADASGRGRHLRSNSAGVTGAVVNSGWRTAPRHGGAGEGGLNANAAAAAAAAAGTPSAASAAAATASSANFQGSTTTSTATGHNWSVRLGEGGKPGWGLTLGEGARPPSPMTSISNGGQQHQRQTQKQATASRLRSRGVVRRRHSSPIASLTASVSAGTSAEWTGEVFMGMGPSTGVVPLKSEASRRSLDGNGAGGCSGAAGGGGSGSGSNASVLESFSANFFDTDAGADGAAKWGGLGAPASTQMKGEFWQQQQQAQRLQQQQQAGAGGLILGSGGAAAATGTEVSASTKFEVNALGDPADDGEMVDAHVMTTMPVDL